VKGTRSSSPQIPLPLAPPRRLDFGMYWCAADNREAADQLQRLASGAFCDNLYLWGDAGTGKSHLLEAACNLTASLGRRCALVPLSQGHEFLPAILEGLEQLDLVCVDDLDCIGGDAEWERALFNLFNRMREARRPLVFTARRNTRGAGVQLADLASRLAWGLVYRLAPLDETSRLAALKHRAGSRGIQIPEDVLTYLSRRVPRDMHTLFDWLDRLDDETLAAQKKVTVPFVRDLLERAPSGAGDPAPK